VLKLYDQIIDPSLMVRRLSLTANRIVEEESVKEKETYEQLDLFTDYEALKKERQKEEQELEREKKLQNAMLDIKKKFGKNAILKGMNLKEGATTIKRNSQIGGHKA
jgi:DNA polymerase V